MIQENASSIFRGQAVGLEPRQQRDPYYEDQRYQHISEEQLLHEKQQINFNDKIMGGQRAAAFLDGKLPELGGTYDYSQRVNRLTGKGAIKMEEENNIQEKMNSLLGSSGDGLDKVNMMLGGTSGSASNKINNILSGGTGQKKNLNVDDYMGIGKTKSKSKDVIGNVLGTSSKSSVKDLSKKADSLFSQPKPNTKVKFDEFTGIGKRAFSGISAHGRIVKALGMTAGKSFKTAKTGKDTALKKINNAFKPLKSFPQHNVRSGAIFNMLGNPERDARKRIKQQRGLSMFGDFDGDKVLNAFDCNPVNYMKQGNQHNVDPEIPKFETFVGKDGKTYQTGTTPYYESVKNVSPTTTYYEPVYGDAEPLDLNYDGIVNEVDKNIFKGKTISEQIDIAQLGLSASKTEKERNNYQKLLAELTKSQRLSEKVTFDKEKWQSDKAEKAQEKLNKQKLGLAELEFKKQKFGAEYGLQEKQQEEAMMQNVYNRMRGLDQFELEKEKYKAGLSGQKFGQKMTREQFAYQKVKDEKQAEKDARKQLMAYDLEKAKLDMAKQKGDLALWENKLKAGENMLGSLIGGKGPVDLGSKVGQPSENFGQTAQMLVGAPKGNFQNMALLSGGMAPTQAFSGKVGDTVGMPLPETKSFVEKVQETMSRQSPEELLQAEQAKRAQMQEEMMNPVQVQMPVQRPVQGQMAMQRPVQRVMSQPVQARPAYPQQRPMYTEPDWDEVTPQEAAQYDLQYAKYLAETSGEHKYRRGPYKKRLY